MWNSIRAYMKRYFQNYRAYVLAKEVKRSIANSLGRRDRLKCFSLAPEQASEGNVLLSYISGTFFLNPNQPIPNTHTNYWESLQMAKTFLSLGYCVDVISYRNDLFLPEKDYSIFVDVRRNLERLAPLLNKNCIKIMHIDTAHLIFHNAAESRRLLELQRRRGITLRPRRFEIPNLGIEYADCATILGNEFTVNTFKYANKPIYRLPIPAAVSYPWPEGKDWESCRRWFLWFSSGGLVHKGLDLALEAFLEMPEYHLIICAPLDREEDFVHAYDKELYRTSNIHTVGWVDVDSPKFAQVTSQCMGVILLSCSEGASTSTMTCMHAGLIPILSYECGLDIDDFGFILKDCSIKNIKDTIRMVADLPAEELKARARRTWESARANHTQERYAEEYRKIITEVIAAPNTFLTIP